MPILIDGHNLIGQMHTISLSDPDDEAQLVMLLRRYATKKRGRKVIVIFDGGVYGHPDNLNGYGVEARFAKSPSDADSELIRRIRMVRRRDEWQVVSSDNAVMGGGPRPRGAGGQFTGVRPPPGGSRCPEAERVITREAERAVAEPCRD